MLSAVPITPVPPSEPRPSVVLPPIRDADARRPGLAGKVGASGRRLHHERVKADVPGERHFEREVESRALQPLERRSERADHVFYSSQFVAQVIAQEMMPRDTRQEPVASIGGLAAYQAAAEAATARVQVVLGPAGPVDVIA